MMKKNFWMITAGLAFVLAACGSSPSILAVSTPTQFVPPPVETLPPGIVIASAEAEPAQEFRVSFAISAPVKEILVKEGEVVKAGQILMTLQTPELEGAVTQAELAEKAAALEFTYWIPHRYDRPPERKWQAEAEWNQKKIALEVASASLQQNTLYAPFDATVIDIDASEGEFAQTGVVVITLADLSNMQIVTTDLSERDVSRVQAGQPVSISIKALDQTVSGKVLRVAPKSKTVGGDVVYPVTITLDEQVKGLLWGMSAEVEINTK